MGYIIDYNLLRFLYEYRPVIYPITRKYARSHIPYRKIRRYKDYLSKHHVKRCRSCLSKYRKGRWEEDPIPISDTLENEDKE